MTDVTDRSKSPPDLTTYSPQPPPTLDLSSAGDASVSERAASVGLATVVMVVAGVVVLAALVPMALSNAGAAGWLPSLPAEIAERIKGLGEHGEATEGEATVGDSADDEAVARLSMVESLAGKACSDYQPGGDDAAAMAAFDSLLWSKLDEETRGRVVARVDDCGAFEWVDDQFLRAQTCAKDECGQNDATFLIDRDGRFALQLHEDGVCSQTTDSGFAFPEAICTAE